MFQIIFWIVLMILIVIFGPLLTIWGLNTLFPVLAIPYALETWFAIIVITAAIRGNVSVKKD